MRRNRQRIRKIPLKSLISEGFWSEWGDLNTQPRHPKCRALPVEPHPDIHFSVIIPRRGGKSKIFCLWSFMWSKPLLCRFRQPGKKPLLPVSQGFAGFCSSCAWIGSTHSQTYVWTFRKPCYALFGAFRHSCGSSLKLFCPVHFKSCFRLLGFVWDWILYIKSASDRVYIQQRVFFAAESSSEIAPHKQWNKRDDKKAAGWLGW